MVRLGHLTASRKHHVRRRGPPSGDLVASLEARQPLSSIINLSDDLVEPTRLLSSKTTLDSLTSVKQVDFTGVDFFVPDCLSNLRHLRSLRSLRLSGCHLTSAKFLNDLPQVEFCDLSHNRIFDLGDIHATLPSLKHLDLSWNTIPDTDCLQVLQRVCPKLDRLDCKGCPFVTRATSLAQAAQEAKSYLPSLKFFTGYSLENISPPSPQRLSRDETFYFSFAPDDKPPEQKHQTFDEGSPHPLQSSPLMQPSPSVQSSPPMQPSVQSFSPVQSSSSPVQSSTAMQSSPPTQSSPPIQSSPSRSDLEPVRTTVIITPREGVFEAQQRLPIIQGLGSPIASAPPQRELPESPRRAFAPLYEAAARRPTSPSSAPAVTPPDQRIESPNLSPSVSTATPSVPTATPAATANKSSLEQWKMACLRESVQKPPSRERKRRTSDGKSSRVPRKQVAEVGSFALQTPDTPVVVQGRRSSPESTLEEVTSAPAGWRKCESTPKSCSTRASMSLFTSNLERHHKPMKDRAMEDLTPGTLRNLRLPDTQEETRFHPRRPLRDQPDASQLESTIPKEPPVSLIGVQLSKESLRLAETALFEDPFVRHRGGNYVIDGNAVHELSLLWSELSSALVWAINNKEELERDVSRLKENISSSESQLLDMLIKFQKMRHAYLACLRRLAAGLEEQVFDHFARALQKRSEHLLSQLQSSATQTTQSSEGGVSFIARCALANETPDPFICLIAALIYADFSDPADDLDFACGHAMAVLASHLNEAEKSQELAAVRTLNALGKEVSSLLTSTHHEDGPSGKDLAILSVAELCALASRLQSSHKLAVTRLLQLLMSNLNDKAQLVDSQLLLNQVQENIINISQRLTSLVSAYPDCVPHNNIPPELLA